MVFAVNGQDMVVALTLMVLLVLDLALCNRLNSARQDGGFGFPEEPEEDKGKRNDQNKLPVFIPNRCGDNELLYPGDYNDDWVCDCRPGYIYHPTTNACYSPFRQGPCPRKSYLYLPKGQYIPQCQTNTCNLDGIVSFHGGCHELGMAGPCKSPELSYVVAVNQTTMQLQCIASQPLHTNLASRFGEDDGTTSEATVDPRGADEDDSGVDLCPVGSKRWMNRTCTQHA